MVKLFLLGRAVTTKGRKLSRTKHGGQKGRTSQLDNILGPKMETRVTCARNEFQLCSMSDHYPVCATIQEDVGQGHFIQQKNKVGWAGWQPSNEDAKIECKKKVMGREGGG